MLSNSQLIHQAVSHYTSQAVKQAYVLMLGLDVLGNPFGLVVGYTKGFGDLFYEPLRVIYSNYYFILLKKRNGHVF